MLAGGLGGLMGTWFKFGWDAFWPPRASGRIPEPEVLISMFTHHPSSLGASHIFSFIFSVLSGIGYGVLVEFLPIASLGTGLVFGFAVWLGAHEVVMPWIGLTPPTWEIPANEQAAELFGHVLWGLVIGVFYEDFRRRWAKSSAAPIEAFIPHEVVAR
jgi:putative membrane protein